MSREYAVTKYVLAQLDQMRETPEMWGPPECIELQYLQLLETWVVAVRPDFDEKEPRYVLNAYERYRVQKKLRTHAPLALKMDSRDLVEALHGFRDALSVELRSSSAYQKYDLALGLKLEMEVENASSTVVTSYLTELRRTVRSAVRGGRRGRAQKDIETLTEFDVPNIEMHQRNGTNATVLFSLQQRKPAQPSSDDQREVSDALGQLVGVAAWAASDDSVEHLGTIIPDARRRQRVAFEALRLVPRGQVNEVHIGGRLVARYEPVRMLKTAKARLVAAVVEGQDTKPFDSVGILRAADLDRAAIRLLVDKNSFTCLLTSEALAVLPTCALGAQIRVRGQQVDGLRQRGLVVVEEVELAGNPNLPDLDDLFGEDDGIFG